MKDYESISSYESAVCMKTRLVVLKGKLQAIIADKGKEDIKHLED